jgi:PAS domain-containing protein
VLSPLATAPPTEALAPDALDGLPDVAVLVLDAELRIVSAAGGALERQGWPPALVEGRRLADVLPRDVYAVVAPRYRLALEGRSIVFDVPEPDGGLVWRIQAVPRPAPRITVLVEVVHRSDVPSRRRDQLLGG